ncbi:MULTISPECIES: ABC transporter permease [unclassified Paenibacillus]|uniref:ABC transporter permease n=1 Tax=Paenibacillus provencensis TaxID=441151 RepID=A0ABW3PMJ9_9BACL|nr:MULTISPECIES: ABC transporter permease [unclassified Paenibacillus]MCM3126871.1 ABC transporter permease [Paenibacillus sp. MER 78]SFS57558.1 dipeptide transport system permease protein [Paenibacillus sp. 453mf]
MQAPHVPDHLFVPMKRQAGEAEAIVRPKIPAWQRAWILLYKNKLAFAGLIVIVLLSVFSVFGPLIAEHGYADQDLVNANQKPSAAHWFGTDDLGRDVFARIIYGAQISLGVGLIAAVIDFAIGVIYGGIAGYFGGRVDNVMMRIVDILYGIPYLLIVILLMVAMGPGLLTIIVALTATGWIGMARIVRGQVLQLKSSEYTLAARALGAGSWNIIRRHLLPNAFGVIIVQVTFSVPSAIFSEAFLSFLGLGIQAPLASWGTMANDGMSTILSGYWWRLLFPSLFISLTMLAFNLLGDGLHQIFDPKQRR